MRRLPRAVPLRTLALGAVALLLVLSAGSRGDAAGKLPLWRIRSAGNSIYLLGSIHALPAGAQLPDDLHRGPFDESAALVLESDLGELARPSVQEELRRRMVLEGPGLSQRLPFGVRLRLERVLRESGLDPAFVEHRKPWAVALLLIELKIREAGFQKEYGVDRHFFDRATRSGKTVLGLEAARAPLEVLDALTEAEQERLLREVLDELPSVAGEVRNAFEAWRSGDPENLAKAMQESIAREPELFRKLLAQRNAAWLPRIEAFLKEARPYFVVVGAAHLVGEEGLLEALRRKGYAVEQL